jgi:hypothetical protein
MTQIEAGVVDMSQILQGLVGHIKDFGHCSKERVTAQLLSQRQKLIIVLPEDNLIIFKSQTK